MFCAERVLMFRTTAAACPCFQGVDVEHAFALLSHPAVCAISSVVVCLTCSPPGTQVRVYISWLR